MNSCSKRAQGQGGLRLTLLSSNEYFAPGCSDSRDHGSLQRGTGTPSCPAPRGKPTRAQHQTAPKLLSASSGKRKKIMLSPSKQLPMPQFLPLPPSAPKHPLWSLLLVKSWLPTASLQPSLPASGVVANSARILSFPALLSDLHTGIPCNNTQRTANTYFFLRTYNCML